MFAVNVRTSYFRKHARLILMAAVAFIYFTGQTIRVHVVYKNIQSYRWFQVQQNRLLEKLYYFNKLFNYFK